MGRTSRTPCRGDGIACIVPPHILRAIVENGDAEQRSWALQALAGSERIRGRRELLGEIATAAAGAAAGKQRTVYDARHGSRLPGAKARGEGDPPSADVAVNEAYDGAGATYDLYHDVFDRDSIDDRGMPLVSTRPLPRDYDNAFWDGSPDGVRGRRREDLRALHEGHRRDRPRADPRRHPVRGQPRLRRPAGGAQRVVLRRLRLAGQATDARADGRRGRLADRGRPVHAAIQRRRRCARWRRPAPRTTTR